MFITLFCFASQVPETANLTLISTNITNHPGLIYVPYHIFRIFNSIVHLFFTERFNWTYVLKIFSFINHLTIFFYLLNSCHYQEQN